MEADLLRFPHKKIRAEVIKEYMEKADYKKAVCFSCGNAARALEDAGIEVLHIGAAGDLIPMKWYTQAEIKKVFPDYFDATSGHLPMELMLKIAERFQRYLGFEMPAIVYVPTGSGETIVCLKLAYPEKRFVAVYDLDKATEYDEQAPLNKLVELLAEKVIKNEKSGMEKENQNSV